MPRRLPSYFGEWQWASSGEPRAIRFWNREGFLLLTRLGWQMFSNSDCRL
jgi:hypothetical protein